MPVSSTSMTPDAIDAIKHAPSGTGVEELMLRRWSPRAFADRPVSAEDLKKMFEAASWAASSYNEQPWRFLVGRRGDETYKKIFDALIEFNQSWAKTAPVLIFSVGKKTFSQNGSPNHYALHDTGAATANLALQATALGLHTHSMAGFDNEKIRESFQVPADYVIGAVTAIGYLGDANALPEQMQKMETSPRERKPLQDFVFSKWENPAKL